MYMIYVNYINIYIIYIIYFLFLCEKSFLVAQTNMYKIYFIIFSNIYINFFAAIITTTKLYIYNK